MGFGAILSTIVHIFKIWQIDFIKKRILVRYVNSFGITKKKLV